MIRNVPVTEIKNRIELLKNDSVVIKADSFKNKFNSILVIMIL